MKLGHEELGRLIDAALAEDLGPGGVAAGDITSNTVIREDAELAFSLITREDIVVAGIDAALTVFRRLDPEARIEVFVADGERAKAETILARIEGEARGLLTAERTVLNILQHLSGIATLTRAFADRLEGTGVTLLDTRKTIPGMRRLAKYAAELGGAENHRIGLYDAVLIKDNHIAVAGGIEAAVARARENGCRDIEVECDTLEQVAEALEAGADRLMLDNMSLPDLRRAVAMAGGRVKLEASGGITLETVREIAETGIDFISVGRLTQSAPAADIGLDFVVKEVKD